MDVPRRLSKEVKKMLLIDIERRAIKGSFRVKDLRKTGSIIVASAMHKRNSY